MSASSDPPVEDRASLWRATLPYATDKDGDKWITEIKEGLAAAVAAGNYQPGAVMWIKRLKYYVDLKYTLSPTDRAHFAFILYDLVCAPDIDPHVMGFFAVVCTDLLRKKKLLPTDDTLVLKWRPLYEAILELSTPKDASKISLSSTAMTGAMGSLVSQAQRYFAPESTAEILEELLPLINVHDPGWFSLSKGLLGMFLPTTTIPPPHPSLPSGTTPFYWIPTIFALWSLSRTSLADTALFLDLIARLAEDQAHANPNWTEEQIRHVFSAGLLCLNLPVGSSSSGNAPMSGGGADFGGKAAVDPFAAFVVWAMVPVEVDEANTRILKHLGDLIQAVETYFHPSNAGRWSYMLARFLQMLSYHFLRRIRQEDAKDCKTPPQYRITPAMRVEFVTTLRPVVYLSLFGKDAASVNCIHNTLKYLAWIEPTLILPGLLERIYPALESLTENHRTISCIGALYHVALPLFNREHYSPGGTHLAALLDLVIPGIDVNDPTKTLNTLLFIRHAISCVPLADLTNGDGAYVVGDCSVMETEETEQRKADDEVCRQGTGIFATWIERFLERVFVVIENLPQEHGHMKTKRSVEGSVIRMIQYTCELIFMQMQPDLQLIALRKIKNFVAENVIPNATKAVAMICAVAGTPKLRLETFVPLCHEQIMKELEHGAATNPTTSSSFPFGFAAMSDARLHWYQYILLNVCRQSGAEVLKWKTELLDIVRTSVRNCESRTGWKWAAKLLRILLCNLTATYPSEARSVGRDYWSNDAWIEISHLYWGEPTDRAKLDIEWHSPSNDEKQFALELVNEFTTLSIDELTRRVEGVRNGTTRDRREVSREFQKWLEVLRNCIRGMTTLIPPDAENSTDSRNSLTTNDFGEVLQPALHKTPLAANYCFEPGTPEHTHIRNLRTHITLFLVTTSQALRQHTEDDTESITTLLRAATALLSDRGCARSHLEQLTRTYAGIRSVVSEGKRINNKHIPRFVHVVKASIVHLTRLEYNATTDGRKPEGQIELMAELEQWSVGGYAVLRKEAQRGLSTVLKCSPDDIKKAVFWRAVKVLQCEGKEDNMSVTATSAAKPTEAESDRLKGALYMLKGSVLLRVGMVDYQKARAVLIGLAKAYNSDKKSIRTRWTVLAKEILGRYQEIAISTKVSDGSVQAARKLTGGNAQQAEVQKTSELVKNKSLRNREEYNGMIVDLMAILNRPDIPMSYRSILIKFLETCLRDDAPVPITVTRYALDNVNSEELAIRQISLKLLRKVLHVVKRRAKDTKTKNPSTTCTARSVWRPQNSQQEYIDRCVRQVTSEEEWKKAEFVDVGSVGWYCWPKTHKIRHGNDATTAEGIPYNDPESRETIDLLVNELTREQFWTKFCKYRTQEAPGHTINPVEAAAGIAPTEHFDYGAAEFYALVFLVLGCKTLRPVKDMVERLMGSEGHVPEKAEQRAIVEVVAGLLAGCKYWTWNEMNVVWEWTGKVATRAIGYADTETFNLWPPALRYGFSHRDPRRHLPLIKQLLILTASSSTELGSNSSASSINTNQSFFAESKKLMITRVLLSTYGWRLFPLTEHLLNTYLADLGHPYLLVRQNMGTNLSVLLAAKWTVGAKTVGEVLMRNANETEGVHRGILELNAEDKAVIDKMVTVVKTHRENLEADADRNNTAVTGSQPTDKETTSTTTARLQLDYKNASGTVLAWLANSLFHQPVPAQHAYLPHIFPEVLAMQVWGDMELQQAAQMCARSYAASPHPPAETHAVTTMLLNATQTKNTTQRWQLRHRTLPLLQIFYFRSIFTMQPATSTLVVNQIATQLLADPNLEVRNLASTTLSGLVRCSNRDAISDLKTQFLTTLQAFTPKRKGVKQEPADMVRKHAAVLGLAALVQAFPYDVPEWMPDVLVALAKCVGDGMPIGASVNKTFAEFRRTHHDNWQHDLQRFDETQRDVLADLLISPSYYA
ncbi:hypothetical protein PhCBS80983_g03421 [Powellomyces hirtus]|uniref:Proteasome activator complex subunit 4 C-terminal domain-containing protein n=1 Tax=Powellomyces hirtus TaxID=109895 RepID=A0A507E1S1_9FUNG|nr:hypothetical protein PhCBS80983_g03421 [Powellomyces hirtus]